MKILSFILSFYVIALNVQPILNLVEIGYEDGCSSTILSDDLENQHEDEDGCTDLCNPFLSCSMCLGFTIPISVLFSGPSEHYMIKQVFYENFTTPQYVSAIWQPPKIG